MKPLLRVLCNPLFVLLLAGGGFYGYYKWEIINAEWNLLRALEQNVKLQKAIGNLTATETVAFVDCLERIENKQGASVKLRFLEMERGDENKTLRKEEELIAKGELTYFDALVLSFEHEEVKGGEKKALFLWKTIFGGKEAPEDGYPLDDPFLPDAYKEISKACERTFFGFKIGDDAEKFWKDIWNLANDPDKLKALGIHSIQTKASGMKLMQGMRYKLTIGSTGKMDIIAEGPFPQPATN